MTDPAPIPPLPAFLAERYRAWHGGEFQRDRKLFEELAEHGQRPHSMVISCCDSRVLATSIFGAKGGEFFIHRNIANLVPPAADDGRHHGTSAAIEFAVMALKVRHIIVMGHSGCGGIENGYHVCNGTSGLGKTAFIRKWLEILKPAFDRLPGEGGDEARIALLEKDSILVSLENLAGFAFVREAVEAGELSLHGLWHDIASGTLMAYDSETGGFAPVGG